MRVLIIDDEPNIRKTTEMVMETMGHECAEAADGYTARKLLEKQSFDVAFLDLKLGHDNGMTLLPELLKIDARLVILVYTAHASYETAVEAIKAGAFDYIPKPFTPEQIRQVFKKIDQMRRLEGRVAGLQSRLDSESPVLSFSTQEPALQSIYDMALKAAAAPATVLVLGESGTGKSVLARYIHENSPRRENAFVTVHCPSLSRELLESELFGHVKGAFTGAVNESWGKVSAAEGGTLFLDEIGELPLEIQPKLLRLLQEREYERVGETRTRRADIRLVAATNRDLEQAVKEGKFREDLYYRLHVLPLKMLSLRERCADLPVLARNYLQFFSQQMLKTIGDFSAEAMDVLQRYTWPGNLRQLRNAIERAVILCNEKEIVLADLPDYVKESSAKGTEVGALISIDDLEKEHIRRVIARIPHLEEASRVLGIDPATLYRKRKKYGLD